MDNQDQDARGMKRGAILTALLIGTFVAFLNENLLTHAFPALMREFSVAASTIQWLSTGYMLVIGVLVPVTALLQQWFTTRQMFMSAMALFLAGTCLCAVSPGFGILLMGRVVQACGTGLFIPLMMNTILALYPPERRGAAMGLMGLVIMVAPVIGLGFVWLNYRYLSMAMAVLHGDSCRTVFDDLCIRVLKECDRTDQAKGRSCIHCDVNRRFRLRHLWLQPNKCLS